MGISSFIATVALVATTAVAPAAPASATADMRQVESSEANGSFLLIDCPAWAHALGWC